MDLSQYRRIAIFRKEDLNHNGEPKGSMKSLEMADFALNEVDDHRFEVTKDRYGWRMGMTYHLSDTEVAKIMLGGRISWKAII